MLRMRNKYADAYRSVCTSIIYLSTISYNITSSFSDSNDKTDDQRHCWVNRGPYIKKALEKYNARVWCLQELSVMQAIELYEHFKENYDCVFLDRAPSIIEIIQGEDIHMSNCVNASNDGIVLNGIFIKKTSGLRIEETGGFWLNEETDNFDDMNMCRTTLWAKIFDEPTGNHIYVFNSHYPLYYTNDVKYKCAEIEMRKMREITNGARWVSCGDRCTFPWNSNGYTKYDVYRMLTSLGDDVVKLKDNLCGVSDTWIGFTYDRMKSYLRLEYEDGDGDVNNDIIVSDMLARTAIHDPVTFKDGELVDMNLLSSSDIRHYINESRYLASSHCMVFAILSMRRGFI